MTALVDLAVTALRSTDTGQTFVSYEYLHRLAPDAVRGFLEALEAVAAKRGLVVETAMLESPVPGIAFRWRRL